MITRSSFLALIQNEVDELEKQIEEMDKKIVEKVETAKEMWADSQRMFEIKRQHVQTEMLQLAAYPDPEPPSTEERHRNRVKQELYSFRQSVGSGIANVRNAKTAPADEKKPSGAPVRYMGISL